MKKTEAREQALREVPSILKIQTHAGARFFSVFWLVMRSGLRLVARQFFKEKTEWEVAIARDVLRTIGPLKGPLVKVGQFLATSGLLPSHMQDELVAITSLTNPLDRELTRAVVEGELGDKIENLFSQFELTPFSTASIAQIHRARLKSGELVAVKVQYPGVDKVIAADLRLLRLVAVTLRFATEVQNLQALIDEVSSLFLRECDFQEELRFQNFFAKTFAYRGDVIVPRVYASHSTEKVLTMDFVEGDTFPDFVSTASEELRRQAAMTIHEVTNEGIFRYGFFNIDPHPGNFLFTSKGVVFIDFGCFKEWNPEFLLTWKKMIAASLLEDLPAFVESAHRLKIFANPEDPGYEKLMHLYHNDPYLPKGPNTGRPSKEDSSKALEAISRFFFLEKGVSIPPDFVAISRVLFGTMLVIDLLKVDYDQFALTQKFHYEMFGPRLMESFKLAHKK